MQKELTLKEALAVESVQKRFSDMLGSKSAGFLTSLINIVNSNAQLKQAATNSILLAAGQAAALDLPISPSLGLAAVVPYRDKKSGKVVAQFQIMRDGWLELCLRTGKFAYIGNEVVYEGELVKKNRFTGEYIFDEEQRKSDKIIGYMACFQLTNGYAKTVYWTVEDVVKHGEHYSKSFKNVDGLWTKNFNSMALKTVLKNLLKKYAPKSIDIINAIETDQASFNGDYRSELGHAQPQYDDNDIIKDINVEEEITELEETEETVNIIPETDTPKKQKTVRGKNKTSSEPYNTVNGQLTTTTNLSGKIKVEDWTGAAPQQDTITSTTDDLPFYVTDDPNLTMKEEENNNDNNRPDIFGNMEEF